jgi:hypothetical protein
MNQTAAPRARRHPIRPQFVAAVIAIAAAVCLPLQAAQAATGCTAGMSQVACENLLPGNPDSEWNVGDGDTDIEGFTTDISANIGGTVNFKVTTTAPTFRVDIYRMGYYQGNGARKIATLPTATGKQQPACLQDSTTGLIDCGNWTQSASWSVPSTAVSGVYFAVFTRIDNGDRSMAPFVVRNDASHADIVYQTSDPTWEAYNNWGGNSFYQGDPAGRAYKLSYNRPYNTRGGTPQGRDFVFSNEYPMIRFLESNGYDVSYQAGVDSDRLGSLITNHKTFVSVGHDEYWSGAQRANVEAARNAGVNLAFFSGNEVFWKTRYEPGIDGANVNYRTLVTYKETWANAKIDPSPEWTGTWRDPRFSPPANGGKPENSLTGTMYMANCCNSTIMVPSADGKMRFWRNTSVQTQAAGQTATLAANTLGYEYDETPDNGFQPAGLVPLSSTTVDTTEYLQDYGSTVAPGTAHHHMTLYRAPSGALVFGAGTVQWSWGLDSNHDGDQAPADVRMQQATMNLFADMQSQPTTPVAGLVTSAASTDHTAPSVTISTPTAGATISGGTAYTVSGTATDAGGGQVGAVEVSIDNGATWHPATGRASWTYAWSPSGIGPVTIKVRASDDSGNVQSTPASVSVTQQCPCSLLAAKNPPVQPAGNDTSAINLGVKFKSDSDGFISGIRFYKETANGGIHTGSLWSSTGTRLATGTYTNETASGWQTLVFNQPVAVNANTTYVASYFAPQGHETGTGGTFTNTVDAPPLHAPSDSSSGGNGVYLYGPDGFPTGSYGASNYWVDPTFLTSLPNDHTAPTATASSPTAGSTGASVKATVGATFSEPVRSSSISITLTPPTGPAVAGTLAYDNQTLTGTLTPGSVLATNTTYTVRVSGATDLAGNVMAAPATWTFTTSSDPAGCPCTLFGSTVPTTPAANDAAAVSLGVKFTSDTDGLITGVRFYKGPSSGGTHTGSLWSSTGTRLATGTFSAESSSGWQTLTFAQAVPVTANTTYIASYYAPQGNYVATGNFFGAPTDTPPLHAPANSTSGGNGVYLYGSDAFPTSTYGAANYWVDPVFKNDLTPPSVQTPSPAAGSTGVSVKASVSATFSRSVQAGSVQMSVTPAGGSAVAGTVTYDAPSFTATFKPTSPLAANTTYTARVSGATTSLGVAMTAPVSWTFTTSSDASGCPCNLFGTTAPTNQAASDPSAVTLGVKFTTDVDGWASGVRFYKGTGNGGSHTGSLWSADGTLLATGTFSNESATGWQNLNFAQAVAVHPNTTYVASYFAPQGHYAGDGGFFNNPLNNAPLHAPASSTSGGNGVYAYGGDLFPSNNYGATNYAVDVNVQLTAPPDSTPPVAQAASPGVGATHVPVTVPVTAKFSESVVASSIGFTLTPATGPAVTGVVSYDDPTTTAAFTPGAALAANTTYTARVSGARDLAGNVMAPMQWTFTTASSSSNCPCSIFGTATPSTPAANDSASLTLGVKFQSDTAGFISGIRFYKGTGNGGTHTGSLWSSTGTRLATGTFTNESATGWQTLTFAQPVAITANTTYVATYYAPQGHYAVNGGFFANPTDNAPLHAPSDGSSGGNGLYLYGSDGFATGSYNASNYWVDPLFIQS